MGIEIGLGTALLGMGGLGLLGSTMQAGAQKSAAQQQADAARQAMEQQRQMFDILNAQQAPYRGAGYSSLSQILQGLQGAQPQFDAQGNIVGTTQGTGYFTKPLTQADIEATPGYQFALSQGMGATRQALNPAGGGSNIDRASQKFAMDYALGPAYQAALAQRKDIYNTLASIAGLGQTAQTQTGQMGMQTAGNLAQLGVGAAGALGAGQIGAAQAYGQGLQGLGNAAFMYNLMRPPVGGGGGVNVLGGSNAATMLPSGEIGPSVLGGY